MRVHASAPCTCITVMLSGGGYATLGHLTCSDLNLLVLPTLFCLVMILQAEETSV